MQNEEAEAGWFTRAFRQLSWVLKLQVSYSKPQRLRNLDTNQAVANTNLVIDKESSV